MTTDAIIGARRVRAPAAVLIADADAEPPTGMPPVTAHATFAAP